MQIKLTEDGRLEIKTTEHRCPFCDRGIYGRKCRHGYGIEGKMVLDNDSDDASPLVSFWHTFWRKLERYCEAAYDLGINPLPELRRKGFRNIKYSADGGIRAHHYDFDSVEEAKSIELLINSDGQITVSP